MGPQSEGSTAILQPNAGGETFFTTIDSQGHLVTAHSSDGHFNTHYRKRDDGTTDR